VTLAVVLAVTVSAAAQPPQGGRGGPAPTGRTGAPVDLTGTWVSVVTEDWEARMVPPVKGDYTTIAQVMNAQARKVADAWEPSMDGRCEAYGVGGVMRIPGRLRISWQDDATLKIETDAGAQTRLLHFTTGAAPAGPRTLQGYSVAEWQRGGGQQDAFLGRGVPPAQLRPARARCRAIRWPSGSVAAVSRMRSSAAESVRPAARSGGAD